MRPLYRAGQRDTCTVHSQPVILKTAKVNTYQVSLILIAKHSIELYSFIFFSVFLSLFLFLAANVFGRQTLSFCFRSSIIIFSFIRLYALCAKTLKFVRKKGFIKTKIQFLISKRFHPEKMEATGDKIEYFLKELASCG